MQQIVAANAACEEVMKSKKFAKILELILLMGNYMNSGSRNEAAFGFEISYLPKVSMKANCYSTMLCIDLCSVVVI